MSYASRIEINLLPLEYQETPSDLDAVLKGALLGSVFLSVWGWVLFG